MSATQDRTVVGYDLGDECNMAAVVVMTKRADGTIFVHEAHVGDAAMRWLRENAPEALRGADDTGDA